MAEDDNVELTKREPPVTHFLSTGCTLLDLAIANKLPGGFPAGRSTQIFGGESTGKTVLAAEAIGSSQRQKGKAWLDDTEGVWDLDRSETIHDVKPDELVQNDSATLEELFDTNIRKAIDESIKIVAPCCYVTDSLTTLPSVKETEEELGKASYGTSRAKTLSAAFRKIQDDLNKTNLALLFIDQERDNVGVTFGDSTTTPGGRALKFYASVRVRLSHEERIKNASEKIIGVRLGFFTRKNKIAPPFREGSFRVLFDYGIDDIGSSIEWLHENDPIWKGKAKKDVPWEIDALKLKGRGLNALAEKVEGEGLEKELQNEVLRVWALVYAPIERKKRVRLGN